MEKYLIYEHADFFINNYFLQAFDAICMKPFNFLHEHLVISEILYFW